MKSIRAPSRHKLAETESIENPRWLPQRHLENQFSTSLPKPLVHLSWNLLCSNRMTSWLKGYWQYVQMVPRDWTRWPPFPCMVKRLKNLLLQNQESFEADCWYITSGIQGLPNDGCRLTFDLFYGKVRFAPPYICMGKMLKNHFLNG